MIIHQFGRDRTKLKDFVPVNVDGGNVVSSFPDWIQ
jgi:hypothetical protein